MLANTYLDHLLALLIGLLVLPDHFWFGHYSPAFHLVLASFVLLVGLFHFVHAAELARR